MDYLGDPVVLLERDGSVAEANEAFFALCGMPRAQVVGHDCRAVEPLSQFWPLITSTMLHRTAQSDRITMGSQVLDVTANPVMEGELTQYVLVMMRDVTSFVRLEDDLRKRNQELIIMNTLSTTFIGANDIEDVYGDLLDKVLLVSGMDMGWIAVLDETGNYSVNSISGFPEAFRLTLQGDTFKPIYENVARSEKPIHILETEDIRKVDFLMREGVALITLIVLKADGGRPIGFMGLATRVEKAFDYDLAALFSSIGNHLSLIAEKIMLFQETQRLSVTDGLTGLYNSRYFYQRLDDELARTKRYNEHFSVVLFDIDNFKVFNDKYGHQAGDDVLVEIAATMRIISRGTDILARYGGEEFIMILPHTGKDDSFTLATRLMHAIEEHKFPGPAQIQVTISGGVATYPDDSDNVKALLYAADMAMYEAKEKGKKRICAYKAK